MSGAGEQLWQSITSKRNGQELAQDEAHAKDLMVKIQEYKRAIPEVRQVLKDKEYELLGFEQDLKQTHQRIQERRAWMNPVMHDQSTNGFNLHSSSFHSHSSGLNPRSTYAGQSTQMSLEPRAYDLHPNKTLSHRVATQTPQSRAKDANDKPDVDVRVEGEGTAIDEGEGSEDDSDGEVRYGSWYNKSRHNKQSNGPSLKNCKMLKKYTTVVKVEGKWKEICCGICQANSVRSSKRTFLSGFGGVFNHIKKCHTDTELDYDNLLDHCDQRDVSDRDVQLMSSSPPKPPRDHLIRYNYGKDINAAYHASKADANKSGKRKTMHGAEQITPNIREAEATGGVLSIQQVRRASAPNADSSEFDRRSNGSTDQTFSFRAFQPMGSLGGLPITAGAHDAGSSSQATGFSTAENELYDDNPNAGERLRKRARPSKYYKPVDDPEYDPDDEEYIRHDN